VILFYILVLMAAMPNHPLFEAPFAGLTVVKWLGIICCSYAFLRLLMSRERPAFVKSWAARFFLVLFVIATLSFLTLSRTDNLTFNPMMTYVSYVLLFFTTISLVDTYERLHMTLLAAIAGEALASLYVIREFQASNGTNLRPGYVAGDSNYFATCAVLVIPCTVYFAKMKSSRLQRWFCGASLVLILFAFTLASSRGGLVGLCVAVVYMIVCSGQSRRAAIVTAVLLVPAFFYCGLAQLLAGQQEYKTGNVFGATAFSTYGAFWMSLAFVILMEALGVFKFGDAAGAAIGIFLIAFTIFNTYMWIGSFRESVAVCVVFTTLEITFILLDLGSFGVNAAGTLGGYIGIICALSAWYTSAAIVLNTVYKKVLLPVGPLDK